nr:DUF917 domain-containing protein [Pseudovibrio flavus]
MTEEDIDALEIGSAILGTGGGGNPYIGKLRAKQAMREGLKLQIMDVDDVDDDALVVSVGGIGAPVVGYERLKEGREGLRCLRTLEDRLNFNAVAVVCEEIGGQNSMEPLITAALAGLPVLDCDGMGRAFPEMQMVTFSIYGHRTTPSALCDLHGNTVIIDHAVSELWHERMARAATVSQGGASVLASAPMKGSFVKQYAIKHTYTQAIALGRAVLKARAEFRDPVAAVAEQEKGKVVFTGKIQDLKRHLSKGFVFGEAHLNGIDAYEGDEGSIVIQNENLIFRRNGKVEVVVPDLIIVLDVETGEAITTEMLQYGQRVAILALPAPELLKTPEALEVVGPRAFGFDDVEYIPMSVER